MNKKKKLSILLDFDDTVMLANNQGVYYEHPLAARIIKQHKVTIYSGNPEAENYAKHHGIPFIFKGSDKIVEADILLDDMSTEIMSGELYCPVHVYESFLSIDDFLKVYEAIL
ncbi:MAG: hypothetical protein JNL74_20015 [Fibrobacteres bacterium]|nr:hypothetical protein [Fibrobacterota bacterium]